MDEPSDGHRRDEVALAVGPGPRDDAAGDHASDVAADDVADDAAGGGPGAGVGGSLSEQQLEALLFVAERPLARAEIARLAGVDAGIVDARLGDLEVSLASRGIRLLASDDRVELATAPEAGAIIARYLGADAVRLSPAALETLAIIAYRQPITKAAVERIRGVDSDYTVRTLLHRRLVVELGRSSTPGRPILYGTGFDFLERFGLATLEELPPLDTHVAARLAEEGAEGVLAAAAMHQDGPGASEEHPDAGDPAGDRGRDPTED